MVQYCNRCKVIHNNNEICPHHAKQLKKHPQLLGEAANFTSVAAQYHLISSQTLDSVAKSVNNITGSNLSYEGTHQFVRDIQVFKQLNVDAYCRNEAFLNAANAKNYYTNATKGQIDTIIKKLNGTSQEVDWLRWKQGKLSSLFEKAKLLGEETTNAPGVDGETINRFTGKIIEKTTIKASTSSKGLGTNISDVLKALKDGTLDPKDAFIGIDGTNEALAKALEKNIEKATANGDINYANTLKDAQKQLKVKEMGNFNKVKNSTKRQTKKISSGQAHATITMQEASKKACQVQ